MGELGSEEAVFRRVVQPSLNVWDHPHRLGITLKSAQGARKRALSPGMAGRKLSARSAFSARAKSSSVRFTPQVTDVQYIQNIVVPINAPADDVNVKLSSTPRSFHQPPNLDLQPQVFHFCGNRARTGLPQMRLRSSAMDGAVAVGDRNIVDRSGAVSAKTSMSMPIYQPERQYAHSLPPDAMSIHSSECSRWNKSEQVLRYEHEQEALHKSRDLKRTTAVRPHRVDRMYYMSGTTFKMGSRYHVDDEELQRLKELAKARHASKSYGGGRRKTVSKYRWSLAQILLSSQICAEDHLFDETLYLQRPSMAKHKGPTFMRKSGEDELQVPRQPPPSSIGDAATLETESLVDEAQIDVTSPTTVDGDKHTTDTDQQNGSQVTQNGEVIGVRQVGDEEADDDAQEEDNEGNVSQGSNQEDAPTNTPEINNDDDIMDDTTPRPIDNSSNDAQPSMESSLQNVEDSAGDVDDAGETAAVELQDKLGETEQFPESWADEDMTAENSGGVSSVTITNRSMPESEAGEGNTDENGDASPIYAGSVERNQGQDVNKMDHVMEEITTAASDIHLDLKTASGEDVKLPPAGGGKT